MQLSNALSSLYVQYTYGERGERILCCSLMYVTFCFSSPTKGDCRYVLYHSLRTTMQSDDPDRDSTRSRRSVSSVLSCIWPKIPLSSRLISSPIASICSYIDATSDAGLAPIMELIVRKEEGRFQHEFVLIRLAKPNGEHFWVRLERRPRGLLPTLVFSVSEATDTVSAV